MEKNIEQAFFNEFLDGGAAWRCLEYMKLKYGHSNLDEYPEELKKVYITDAPSIIKELTDAYDSKPLIVSIDGQPPLMWTEIEKNLEDCKDDGPKNRYLYSLLLPFKEWSEVFFPKHSVECFRQEIEQCEHDIPYHEKRVANLKDGWDKDEALGDIEACKESINESNERIKWLEGRHDYYLDIFRNAKEGSVECYCYMWYRALYVHYANHLDAMLLKFNIDLLALQDQFGIWLKYDRNILRIYGYIGTLEWTQKLIDNLPTQQDAVPDNHRIANVQTALNSSSRHFDVDLSYIEKIYNHIVNDAIPNTITNTTFSNCVSTADFSTIWEIKRVKKAKLRYTICALSGKMQNDWYKLAAQSIGSTPQKCSGANVDSSWKDSIKRIK